MPSQLHEAHLLLFRNQPALAAKLIRDALGVELPPFREVREVSADLTEFQPVEYRADMVIELWAHKPVHGIIVEVQLSRVKRKRFVWPAYVANLRARLECPVSLLVVTPSERVARWAARPIHIGGEYWFTPHVLGPAGIPEMTSEQRARENPELAVLSAMAHGRDDDPDRAVEIALAALRASGGLDVDLAKMYGHLIVNSLSEAAREALTSMPARKYELQVPPEEREQLLAQLRELAEVPQPARTALIREAVAGVRGEARGRIALLIRQLTAKFGPIETQVNDRIQRAPISELDAIGERLLTARTLQDALGRLRRRAAPATPASSGC